MSRKRDERACKLVDFIAGYVHLSSDEQHARRYCWDNKRGQLTRIIENKLMIARNLQLEEATKYYDIEPISSSNQGSTKEGHTSTTEEGQLSSLQQQANSSDESKDSSFDSGRDEFFNSLDQETDQLNNDIVEAVRTLEQGIESHCVRVAEALSDSNVGDTRDIRREIEPTTIDVEVVNPNKQAEDDYLNGLVGGMELDMDEVNDTSVDDADNDSYEVEDRSEGWAAMNSLMSKAADQRIIDEDIF